MMNETEKLIGEIIEEVAQPNSAHDQLLIRFLEALLNEQSQDRGENQ